MHSAGKFLLISVSDFPDLPAVQRRLPAALSPSRSGQHFPQRHPPHEHTVLYHFPPCPGPLSTAQLPHSFSRIRPEAASTAHPARLPRRYTFLFTAAAGEYPPSIPEFFLSWLPYLYSAGKLLLLRFPHPLYILSALSSADRLHLKR